VFVTDIYHLNALEDCWRANSYAHSSPHTRILAIIKDG